MPSVIGALWRRRSPAVVLAALLWCAGGAVTVANLAGYVGEHVEQYQAGRQTMATGRSMAMEWLARLQGERRAIVEMRPAAAITVALNYAPRSERPALREALALAKRRDALDLDLAVFEQRLSEIPQVAIADASAAVLSDISGTTISDTALRRLRLALLLACRSPVGSCCHSPLQWGGKPMPALKDITDQRFGRLTAISRAGKKQTRPVYVAFPM